MHSLSSFFFFNDTATTEIYTLSLHDALPIFAEYSGVALAGTLDQIVSKRFPDASSVDTGPTAPVGAGELVFEAVRSEEHTSELQSHLNLVCRLLLEKKKNIDDTALETPAHIS